VLELLRLRVEAFLERLAAERYELHRSHRRRPEVGKLHAEARDLFGAETIDEVQMALAGAVGREEKRLRYLLEYLARGHAAAASATALDATLERESFASVEIGGEHLPLRSVAALVAETEDPARRRAIEAAMLEAGAGDEPLREELLARQRTAVEDLGHGSYRAALGVLGGIDFGALETSAATLLSDTEPAYRELLAWYLPRAAGVAPADAGPADLPRLERAPDLDEVFGTAGMLRRVQDVLSETGIPPSAGGRLRIESWYTSDRALRARCHLLKVPGEVVVVAPVYSGRPAYAHFLEALGRALPHAHADPELPVEFRWLGDGSVPRAWGLLLEGLLANPAFLGRVLHAPSGRLADLRRHAALVALLRARRMAARLRFELRLHEGLGGPELRSLYAELFCAATGVRCDPGAALLEARPGLPAARGLQAEALRVLLAASFRDSFDEDWFRNPRAGPRLLALLSAGREFSAGEVAVQLTSGPLRLDRVSEYLLALAA
jgi:hypothetical protein